MTVLIGLVGVLVPLYLQSRGLEERMSAKIANAVVDSEARMRAENREAHALIGTNIDKVRTELTGQISKLDQRDRLRAGAAMDAIVKHP